MISSWQLQEAKNKLSQLVDEAVKSGPQIITRRGVEVVIVLSVEEYRQLKTSKEKLSDFFRQSPLAEIELDLTRDKSPVRDEFVL
ncbi:type II toxin-antitoxin system Phd/YefM family antitoxin [Candidatus Leptofilum sp.]|uniref:type II toxin-antitoxin system Phd/YefM family antitoxin n=1 Tax=Candidatus Leptofilum sp. TaxID=3241576 RepID=UPI003B590F13